MKTRIHIDPTTMQTRCRHPFAPVASVGLLLLAAACPVLATPSVETQFDAYFPDESIVARFAGGPGNPKDWIGIYPVDVEPGSVPSTLWNYVDGTQTGAEGIFEGTVQFPAGLSLGGDWAVFLLENDGYTPLAMNTFQVVDPFTTLVRPDKRQYSAGETIVIFFDNGLGNAKDWIGVYSSGQTPGSVNSTLWSYVDGSQNGVEPTDRGHVTFPGGLSTPGTYEVHLLIDDGYDILASASFTVAEAVADVPRLQKVSPVDGAANLVPELVFSASIANGATAVATDAVVLTLDGTPVKATVFSSGGLVSVDYTSPDLPAPGSSHTWVLTAPDNATPPHVLRVETTATVAHYRNIVLPPPIYFDNFNAASRGGLPDGWTQKSYTTPIGDYEDFEDLGSATYGRWVVVDSALFTGSFITYGNPEDLTQDYQRVLSVNPMNVLEGQIYRQPLATGSFVFGNSGYANGSASQVLYLFTPDFNLTGHDNVHLCFKSLWEQNQDSIAAIEYSIDRGATWMPIAYFLDGPDIVTVTDDTTGEVRIDAEATFYNEHGDVARYVDDDGFEVGGYYGAFIGAPISPDLAPYLQARVDDNPVESKRIELFALPAANNQPAVRFRFAHAGTDSWYFGIDDFGLYSIANEPGTPPTVAVARDGDSIRVTWTGLLQSADSLSGPWTVLGGATSPATFPVTGSQKFFRSRN